MYSKKLFLLAAIALTVVSQQNLWSQKAVSKGLKEITPEKIKTHINYLASDALLGRDTPSPGQDSAASYITRAFVQYDLAPVNGSYLAPVPLVTTSLGDDNLLEVTIQGVTKTLNIKTDFIPFESTAGGSIEGNIVFAGYGITAPERGYDDYSGIDAKGKIALILTHIPRESDTAKIFNVRYKTLTYKVKNAVEHGCKGVLVMTDPLNHMILSPKGFPWPTLYKNFPKEAVALTLKDTSQKKVPLVHVGKEMMNILFGGVDSLKSLETRIDKELKPMSKEFSGITIKLKVSTIENRIKSSNIVGYIAGSDPKLKDELVVIGAHYDHVGFMKQHKEGEKYIYNGADDNASGTSGLLSVAEAFSKCKVKPRRSVLFIAFTAEEKGLFGSQAYVQNPLFALNNTVAMLNMDMIGRGNPDTLHLEAGDLSPDLTSIAQKENSDIGFKILVDGNEFLDRSDQSSFYHKNIPFIMFFAGLHPDYHTVRDRPETIDTIKASKIARLVFKTAWVVANDNKHYKLIESK